MLHRLLKSWFLIGLGLLALLAIPGVVLVVLALFEQDGFVNQWLMDRWEISYQLAIAPWGAVILLLMPVVLVILYFLKLKRKPIQVPSTFLWKKSIEDLHVNSLFQWLRNNILLLLQLLVLLFLIYSVLGVRYHGSSGTRKHYILMIDNSASMSAKDVAPSRLEWAKAEAIKEIESASENDVGMIIVFNSKATTIQTYTSDRGKLRDAVRSIEPTQRTTRIEEALALAESLANPVRSTEDLAMQPDNADEEAKRTMVQNRGISTIVHFYSDGRFAKLSEATLASLNSRIQGNTSLLGNLNLRYHRAGKKVEPAGSTNNLGIIGFNVLRQPAPGQKNLQAPIQQLLAFVRVANFRKDKALVKLKLDVYVNGVLTHPLTEVMEINGRTYLAATEDGEEKDEAGVGDRRFVLPLIEPGRSVVLHAALDRPNDEFALDDEAWLVVGTTRKAKILIVGQPNPVLDAFFDQEGTKRIAVSERITPAELDTDVYRKQARSGLVDLVIFDRCAPADEADMPQANTFFIDRPPPPWVRGKERLKNPLLMPSKQAHPLMRHLTTIWDVRTHEAFVFDVRRNLDPKFSEPMKEGGKKRELPTITRIIETSNQVPLLFTLPRGPYTDLAMAFPLMNDAGELVSDWPLQTSFPLFFRNVLYILGNVDDSVRAISVQPGEPVVLRPEAGVKSLEITTPRKEKLTLERGNRPDFQFAETEQVGVYRFQVLPKDDLPRSFAVNLLDATESNIEPRQNIRIGSERFQAGEEKTQPRDIWKWILLLAVFLLIAEWYVYHRRIAV